MKIKIVIIIFLALLLFGCMSYHFEFKPEHILSNELMVYIFSSEYHSKCFVHIINPNFGNQLIDIEYINGWIKIGDFLFTLEKENIDISLTLDNNVFFKMFPVPTFTSPNNNFMLKRDGNISHLNVIVSEEEKLKILQNTTHIIFGQKIDYQIIKKLYKQKNKNIKLFLECKLITDDKIINVQLNENMVIEFFKQY
jgi:hypothetical protein